MNLIKKFTLANCLSLAVALFFFLLTGIGTTSCSNDEEDGSWDPMKWKTETPMGKDRNISVPASGDTYIFTCKNYDGFWISEVQEKDAQHTKVYYERDTDCDPGIFETLWGKVSVLNNQLTVQLDPNQSSEKRQYLVTVTAGDIFCTFTFNQAAK